jgi:hypothetical protein
MVRAAAAAEGRVLAKPVLRDQVPQSDWLSEEEVSENG